MKHIPEIIINQGLKELHFGIPIEDVVALLGQADEVEDLSIDNEESTTVLHYYENNLTLFFEEVNPVLSCVEVSHPETLLFGEKIFHMTEKQLVALMTKNNYFKENIELEAWGEKRISFDDAIIDFYFEKGKLNSIVFGK